MLDQTFGKIEQPSLVVDGQNSYIPVVISFWQEVCERPLQAYLFFVGCLKPW